jgi:hypothetical protein
MSGVFKLGARKPKLPNFSFSMPELGSIAVPAMAVGGLIGVVGVLLGLQCGGLDKCFFPPNEAPVAALASADAVAPDVRAEPRLAAEPLVAAEAAPTTPAPDARTLQVDRVIVGSFAAVSSNDEGWLRSARAGTALPEPIIAEPDAPAEIAVAASASPAPDAARSGTGQTAAEAATSLLADAPVVPLDRPQPLEISAYADAPRTAPAVSAEAEQKLEQVAAAAKPEPEPVEVAAATEPAAASGDTRTVAGSGVNVRSGPGKSNGTLFTLAPGKTVNVLEDQRGWLKVTDDQNRTGWLYRSFVN